MKKLTIIHFNDIAKYPPALNLIEYFANKESNNQIIVLSRTKYSSNNSQIKFNNTEKSDNSNAIFRLMSYLWFYFKCFISLLKNKPVDVIYYESLSYFPIFVYKLFYPKIKIICHYHEYESKKDYRNSMMLNRFNHFLEKKTYANFCWISHTNNFRLDFFLKDNTNVKLNTVHFLPNYPPKEWYNNTKKINFKNYTVTNFVCVGALDFEDMYLKEFMVWIIEQKGKATLNLYSSNIKQEVLDYINALNSNLIFFNGAVPYFDLPKVLRKYHIGLILYKCNTLNYVYNEPNKYFEYYSCGLDVWFPKEMIAMKPNIQVEFRPSVIEVDFSNMKSIDMMINTSVKWHLKKYNRESVFKELETFLES